LVVSKPWESPQAVSTLPDDRKKLVAPASAPKSIPPRPAKAPASHKPKPLKNPNDETNPPPKINLPVMSDDSEDENVEPA
jgi:hypothetical protein